MLGRRVPNAAGGLTTFQGLTVMAEPKVVQRKILHPVTVGKLSREEIRQAVRKVSENRVSTRRRTAAKRLAEKSGNS